MGDVHAVDVMYHNNCLNRYIKKFQYHVDALMAFEVDDDRSLLEDTIKELISSVEIETQRYALSDVRDLINEKLCEKASGEILIFSYYCTKKDPGPLSNRISVYLPKQTSSGLFPRIKFPFNGYSSNGLKSVKRTTAVLSFLVIHTKWMRTCIFQLKMDRVLPRNYSSARTKSLMIESCSISIVQLKLQNTTASLTLMCLSVQYITSNS